MKKKHLVLLIIGLLFGSLLTHSLSAETYDTYHVMVYAGEHGTLTYTYTDEDGNEQKEENLPYKELAIEAGQRFDPNAFEVVLPEDSIYYSKGFQYSGTEDQIAGNIPVNEDVTLVVRYGIKGDQVAYTVRYVERGSNRQLLEPVTYHGNVGDEVIVAYRYVEGYRPSAYNARISSLSANETENIITFEYTRVTVEDIIEDGGVIPGTSGGTGNAATGGGNAPTGGNGTVPSGSENTEPQEPVEMIDIVDPSTPTTNPGGNGTDNPVEPIINPTNTGINWLTIFGISIGVAGLLILFLFLLWKRKNDDEE